MTMDSVRDALISVARLRTGLLTADPDGDVRRFYPDVIDGLWIVPLFGPADSGRTVVLLERDGLVEQHGGLARAAALLAEIGIHDAAPAWVAENLVSLLDATGGSSPAMPRYADRHTAVDDGEVRLTLTAPESLVRYAAGGAIGPMPDRPARLDNRGAAAPASTGEMTVTLSDEGSLSWSYVVDDEVVGRRSARRADAEEPYIEVGAAERAIAAARRRLTAQAGQASQPVALHPNGLAVELIGAEPTVIAAAEEGAHDVDL